MGIYSTQAAQVLKESDVEFNPNAAGLLEFVINSQRADQAMFDTMIELDFREAYIANGQILVEAGDEAKADTNSKVSDNIFKKILSAIEKVIQTIMLALEKLKQIVLEKTKLDKKLVKDKLDPAKIKANLSDKDKERKVGVFTKDAKFTEALNYLVSVYNKDIDPTKGISDSLLNAQKSKFEEYAKISDSFESQFDYVDLDKFSDFEGLYKIVNDGYSKLVDDVIGKAATDAVKKLKEARGKIAKSKRAAADDEARARLNNLFIEVNSANSCLTKLINFGTSSAVKAISEARKAYATFLTIQNRKGATNESFTYSDAFIYAFEAVNDVMFDEITLA